MITNVFTRTGEKLKVADAYVQLIALNPSDPHARVKAAGSLGGASRSGFIKLVGGYWTRVR